MDVEHADLLAEARAALDPEAQIARLTLQLQAARETLAREVDARQRAEASLAALATDESDSRRIVDSIPGMVCSMTPGGQVDLLNQQILDYFGKSTADLREWALTDAVHPDDLDRVVSTFSACLASGAPYDVEHRCRRADGIYRWFHVRGLPVRDPAGAISCWCVLLTDIDDRRRAEDALLAREKNLQQIINALPVMAWAARPDGTAEFFNQHYLDYIGQSADQLKDWGWTSAVHPEDLPSLASTWQALMVSGERGETEARLRRHDGSYRWHLFRTHPLRAESGEIDRWYGTNTDINDRKGAEQALRARERDLGSIINTIPVLAWCNLPDGSNEFLNQPWHDYTGLSQEEAHGWGWQVAIHPEELPRLLTLWQKLLASGESGEIEARLRRRDGIYRWFLFRVNPFRDEAGVIVKWYGTNTDIDDLKRAEQKLRRSESFLAEGQRLSSTGSFSWWVDTGEVEFSAELYRIFEFDPGVPLMISMVTARTHPDDAVASAERLSEATRTGKDLDFKVRLKMPDGSVKYIQALAYGTRAPDGRLEYIGVCQDVTQARLFEEALGKARSELAHIARVSSLGALTASIAHEVNQPLSGIVTNASACLRMLAAEKPNLEAACETARRTIRDANRASDVIKRLRALFDKKAAYREPVDLNAAIQEVAALMTTELRKAEVTLELRLAEQLPTVRGDRVQLQQVIMNLLLNACDSMSDQQRRLCIVTTDRDEAGRVRLSVKDEGTGFDPEVKKRLFEAFYTTKSTGMGVGLSICRSIIESHHGRIWAAVNDGPGATFAFSLSVDVGDGPS